MSYAWEYGDDAKLQQLLNSGLTAVQAADHFPNRSYVAVKQRARVLRNGGGFKREKTITADTMFLKALQKHHGAKARANAETFDDGYVR